MKLLRGLLFSIVLLLAQSGALTHALEHVSHDDAEPSLAHSCGLCIAAQGLDAPLISTSDILVQVDADVATPAVAVALSPAPPDVSPCARAPPSPD